MKSEVVIVGAGPTGLMLACELALSGVRPLVLERRPQPSPRPRANGLVGLVVRMLDYRGLLDAARAGSPFSGPLPRWQFGPIALDFTRLEESPVLALLVQQPRLEQVLGERAAELGVEIARGRPLSGLAQDGERVVLDVDGDRLEAGFVVGCDGASSAVRRLAGIDFPGTTDPDVLRLGHFQAPPSMTVLDGEIDLPGVGRVGRDWIRNERGGFTAVCLQPGVLMVAVHDPAGPPVDMDAPMTVDELRAAIRRVLDADVELGEPIWLSRTRSQSRLAARYREGRVFLAGDAAHLFPAGGSALNVGLMDAVNLSWKLGAALHGWAPPGLLDTYDAERRAAGARTLVQTRVQAALGGRGEEAAAVQELLTELLGFREPLRHLGRMLQGSDVRYPMPGAAEHPLLGTFVDDLPLRTERGAARVSELMRAGRPLLLDFGETGARAAAASGWGDRVDAVSARSDAAPADALLLRPDGYVVWVGVEGGPGPENALAAWFGEPVRATTSGAGSSPAAT